MFCLSKGHYYLDRIPRSSPFYKILFSSSAIWSWISSTPRPETTQIQVLLSKYSLSVEVLIALVSLNCSHSLAFPSHLSISLGGDHCDFSFFPKEYILTSWGHITVTVALPIFSPCLLASRAQFYFSHIAAVYYPLTVMLFLTSMASNTGNACCINISPPGMTTLLSLQG